MQKIYSQPRRTGKTSRARAAIRVLRKAGYTWDNGIWQAPERSFLTLAVRECDIDRIKAEWQHAIAKAPCADMRLQPYQEKYMRKANGLHQIAEPDVQEAPAAVAVPDERAAFECDWLRRHYPLPMNTRLRDDGRYGDHIIQGQFEAWCEGRAAVAATQAEVQTEPVMIYHGRCTIDCGEHGHHDVEMLKMIPAGAKLYTAPQAQPADALTATLPKSNTLWRLLTNGYDWDFVTGGNLSERDRTALKTRAKSTWAAICTEANQNGADAQPADALDAAFEAVRKRFCKLPRYSFLLDGKGNVRRVPSFTGNWVEFEAAHTLFDPQSVDDAQAAAQEGDQS